MGGRNITFADCGGEKTCFAASLFVLFGAEKKSIVFNGDYSNFKNCDAVLDDGCLSYELLRKEKSDIIHISITAFGLSGPKKDYTGDSYIAAAAGGSMHMCGKEDAEPIALPGNQAEKLAGLYAANALYLALLDRKSSGKGCHIDISMQEAVASSLDLVLVRNFYYGENPHRTGSVTWNRQCFIAPCQNGKILVHLRPSDWQTITDWMDTDGMAADLIDEKWNNKKYRYDNIEHIISIMSKWTQKYTKEELIETAQLMRMAWAEVTNPEVKI